MTTIAPLGSIDNPVRCDGIPSTNQYLSQLLGPEGQFLQFQRLRNVGAGTFGNIVDEYLVESISDSFNALIYIDSYHQWKEKNPPLNLRIQPLGGIRKRTQIEEMQMSIRLSNTFLKNFNKKLPDHAMYVCSKAVRLSEMGPTLYAFNDFFNYPLDHWNLKVITEASKQISTELRGFCSDHPLLLESIDHIEEIISTFHFDLQEISPSNFAGGLYQIKSTHTVEEYPFDWWIKEGDLGDTEDSFFSGDGQPDPGTSVKPETNHEANNYFAFGLLKSMSWWVLFVVLVGIAAISFSDLFVLWRR